MREIRLLVAALVVGVAASWAFAQNAGQTLSTLASSDLVEVIRGSTAAHLYATMGAIRDGRFYALALTASSGGTSTMTVAQSILVINASGGLSTYNVVFPPTSIDGKVISIFTNQTISTLTLSTSNGATINGNVTSLSANNDVDYVYDLATTTWYRFQ